MVRRGWSQTYHSRHMIGRAIDLNPLPGSGTTMQQIEDAMKEASQRLGIPMSREHDMIKHWDPYHFSLQDGFDTSKVKVPEMSLKEKQDLAKDEAKRLMPNDPTFADIAAERTRQNYNREQTAIKERDYNNEAAVVTEITKPGIKPAADINEVLARNPAAAKAYEEKDKFQQNKKTAQ